MIRKKPALGLYPRVDAGFPKRSCSNEKRKPGYDSIELDHGLGAAEHAAEDGVDVREMKIQVEMGCELFFAQIFAHVLVGLEQGEEFAASLPRFHGIALHQAIGVLARHALLCQRQKNALGMDQSAKKVEILFHVGGVDDEFVDHVGEAAEREIERHRCVRADH